MGTIKFECSERGIDKIVTPIQGSPKSGGGHDDRGGGKLPAVRAGYSNSGSCEVVVVSSSTTNKNQTLSDIFALISPVGSGDIKVSGTGRYEKFKSWNALIDVTIASDSVQTATISWKGSANPEAAGTGGE